MSTFEPIFEVYPWIPTALVGVLGLLVGSFLNVVIHRLPKGQSIVTPRSKCVACGHRISAIENIPIISWIALRGRCKGCNVPISARYPAVELLNTIAYMLCLTIIGYSLILPFSLLLVSSLIALAFIDAEHMILPNRITYSLFIILLGYRILDGFIDGAAFDTLLDGFLGALVGAGFLWGLGMLWKVLRGVEGMGLGDVKMMAGVGMFLGWELVLLSIFIGAFFGTIGGLMIARREDSNLQAQIPFGVFLSIGTFISLVFGERLIAWYLEKVIF